MDIYIARGEERKGPYSEVSIQQFLLDGTELAWQEGLDEWVALIQIVKGGVQDASSAQPPLKVPTHVIPNSPKAEAAMAKEIDRATEKPGCLFFFKKLMGLTQLKAEEPSVETESAQESEPSKEETRKQAKKIFELIHYVHADIAWQLIESLNNPRIYKELLSRWWCEPYLPGR